MQTFMDAPQLDGIIEGFLEEGWLVKHGEGNGARLTLTAAGKAKRESIFELQREVRRRAMRGVTEREYATVIDVLERMVRNLEVGKEH